MDFSWSLKVVRPQPTGRQNSSTSIFHPSTWRDEIGQPKMKTIVLLALINFIGVSTVWGACRRFPGAEQIWSNPSLRFVFIGEVHGSNETPAALRELLCDALVHGRHVTVALERPSVEQADLDSV